MLELALWLKRNGFKADQVQAFLPSPMASATAMYSTGYNPLKSLRARERVQTAKTPATRKLHKAFLRYHDSENWPLLRAALTRMGREDLIGSRPNQLVPHRQPRERRVRAGKAFHTQHTGLPPGPKPRSS
jgi:radical SAM superfamily enzyme YgiQ (UPF0313 family)